MLTLFVTGVFGSDADGSTPAAAVKSAVEAAKNNDVDALKANLCKADLDRLKGRPESGVTGEIKSYSIGRTTDVDDTHAKVQLTATGADSQSRSQQVSVVKENGDWKVCFSDGSSDSGTADSGPAATTGQPTDGSSGSSDAQGGGHVQVPKPGSTYTLPNGSSIVIPSVPAIPSYTPRPISGRAGPPGRRRAGRPPRRRPRSAAR